MSTIRRLMLNKNDDMKKQLIFYLADYPAVEYSNVSPICTSQLANTFGMSTSDVLNFFKNLYNSNNNTKTFPLYEEYDMYIIKSTGATSIIHHVVWSTPKDEIYLSSINGSLQVAHRIEFIAANSQIMFDFDSNFSTVGRH